MGEGCVWNSNTVRAAARTGHWEVLEWARANGCPWTQKDVEAWDYHHSNFARCVRVMEDHPEKQVFDLGGIPPPPDEEFGVEEEELDVDFEDED